MVMIVDVAEEKEPPSENENTEVNGECRCHLEVRSM